MSRLGDRISELGDRFTEFRNTRFMRETFPPGWARAVGFEYATLVGLTIGLPLSTGRVRREGELIVLTGLPKWAFKRGGTTVGRVYLTRDNDSEAVLKHEQVHVEQWRKYGLWLPVLYALHGQNPLTNRFEIEAGLEDGGYVPRSRPAARKPRTRAASPVAPADSGPEKTGPSDEL
ncbi:Fe-S oxidoreductase [Amnibacterium flavum]|uniref:Fe-S oxidoreductase n=1 Tax=Amnibacterium flavum TaxID=2173173 RepID=UPI0026B26142